jgi:hypothetical protein
MPNFKVEPPIPLSIAALLIAIAEKENNGYRIDKDSIDMVDLTVEQAAALDGILIGDGYRLVRTDEEF